MASQTVADHLLARLREWGVQHVFGYPGDGINGLLAAWGRADDQPRFVQARHEELEYSAPTHEFKMVPSSLGIDWPTPAPDDAAVRRAADLLNAGSKVAILAGSGARGARAELEQVADLLGAGVAKALLGKDVLS